MKERIIKIMETEGLTAARFAEAIGTQRATLSHILSGRNNVSLEITQKILDCFPRLSPDWLLRGAGDMYREEKPLPQQDLFSNKLVFSGEKVASPPPHYKESISMSIDKKQVQTSTIPFGDKVTHTIPYREPQRTTLLNEPPTTHHNTGETTNVLTAQLPPPVSYPERSQRRVTKIMIFYSDSTYDTFISEHTLNRP
ncbi:MAG: helix-turn-helix domain-containing protein [Tannerellaceae bacterium]|jgi:transcriptional regulator with XRE-family HTH domain|nr:helix-turn-helix domain-containing protein [Tannerellaceae bacterium]